MLEPHSLNSSESVDIDEFLNKIKDFESNWMMGPVNNKTADPDDKNVKSVLYYDPKEVCSFVFSSINSVSDLLIFSPIDQSRDRSR